MSIKRGIAIVGAVVMTLLAGAARPASGDAAHGTATVQVTQADVLSAAQMQSASGGCFCPQRRLIKKVIKWVKKWWNGIFGGSSSTVVSTTEETSDDPTLSESVTDFYEDNRTTDEFYQDGVLSGTQESSTGFVFTGSVGGGGGGDTGACEPSNGCYAY